MIGRWIARCSWSTPAARAGVAALKLQTYTADTMTLDLHQGDFLISDPNSLWSGRSLYDLYREAHTPWEWHEAIFERCRKHGIIGFSTPFDETAVEFLEGLQTPCYKVASFENTDIPPYTAHCRHPQTHDHLDRYGHRR